VVYVEAASRGSITGGSVTLPAGGSATSPRSLAAQNDGTGAYGFVAQFASQSALNTAYADGTYGLQITGASSTNYSASLSLSGDVYPSATPLITNTTWSGGKLVVNPSASFTLNWDAFSGATASDKIVLSLTNPSSQIVFLQFLSPTTTSQTFTTGFFQPNQIYQGSLFFVKVTATDTTDILGSTGFSGFADETRFDLQTIPEPTTFAMLSLGAVLSLASTYHKRRSKN
jgi:hypothetical protein